MTLPNGIASIAASIILLGVFGPLQYSQATDQNRGEVTVVANKEMIIQENLPWSQQSITAANKLINRQKADLAKALKILRHKGASIVEVVVQKPTWTSPNFLDSSIYGTDYVPWRLRKFESSRTSKIVSSQFPGDQNDMANFLTRIKSSPCSLEDFALWNPNTWFRPATCEIETPSASKFLRASMANAFKRATLEVGSFELQQLKFALGPNTHPRIEKDELYCPELGPIFGGDTRIPLKTFEPVGGYEISVNLKLRKATFIFLGPDQKALAASAYKLPHEDFVRFF